MKATVQQVAVGFVAVAAVLAIGAPIVHAQTAANSRLQQQINPGVLSTDFRNSSNGVVATPQFTLGARSVSNSQQTAAGTMGDTNNRISVDNPGGANNGWTLSLNVTDPATTKWVDGAKNYDYKGTAAQGRLTVDPSVATILANVGSPVTGLTKGASASFTSASPITLLTAGSTSDDIWNGYLTGVSLTQTIPASQPAGTYTIDLTQTVVVTL